jgi:pilus assembly protein CpaB
MNRRLVSIFIFAIAVAGIASLFLYRVLASQLSNIQKPAPSNKLLVAAHDLQVGTLLKDSDLQQVVWSGPVPNDAITDTREITGRGVVENIYGGEAISKKRLAARGAGAGLAATIPVGMRAVALKVDEVVGLAGFVVPGMRVDVLVSSSARNSAQNDISTRTMLQNIAVLSAGQHIERNTEGKPDNVQVVNLLVTPDQAEILSLVSNETKVQLVLRNPLDTKEGDTHGASLAKLFGGAPTTTPVVFSPAPKHLAPVAKVPVAPTVEVYSGSKRTEQSVEGGVN